MDEAAFGVWACAGLLRGLSCDGRGTSYKLGGSEYDGFILVTALFVPLLLVSTAILWKLTGKISPMQIMTAVLVTVFGGLTVWLNDDRFIKMKPTLIYLIFAGILGFGLLRGQSYLRLVMQDARCRCRLRAG